MCGSHTRNRNFSLKKHTNFQKNAVAFKIAGHGFLVRENNLWTKYPIDKGCFPIMCVKPVYIYVSHSIMLT